MFLAPLTCLDFDSSAADKYGDVRLALERAGARVTNNVREFSRGDTKSVTAAGQARTSLTEVRQQFVLHDGCVEAISADVDTARGHHVDAAVWVLAMRGLSHINVKSVVPAPKSATHTSSSRVSVAS